MKNAVRNLVAVSAASPQIIAEARSAVLALAKTKDAEGAAEDASGRIVFTVEWEPVFKDIKELSTKYKDATFTLYGDAFAKQHWMTKNVYQGGKLAEEAAVSRIDGEAFRKVYQEIFGEAYVTGK